MTLPRNQAVGKGLLRNWRVSKSFFQIDLFFYVQPNSSPQVKP
jgi:hypothetical protein